MAAGQSTSNATDQPAINAYIGSGTNVNAGGTLALQASHDSTVANPGASATAESPSVAVLGYGGATPTSISDASVNSYVLSGGILHACGSISILTASTNDAAANAHSVFAGVLGAGTSTATTTIDGTGTAQMNGSVTGGQSLTISSLTSNLGTSSGGSVSAGLIAGLGVTATTTVSPTIQALIGNSANVHVSGAVNLTSQSIDNARPQQKASRPG